MSFYNFYNNNNFGSDNSNNENNNGFWQGYASGNSNKQGSQVSEDDIKSTYEKYRGYNQNELYNEFLKETAKQKANGSLSFK